MKKLIFISLLLLSFTAKSQINISIKDINTDNFPRLSAKIRAVNNSSTVIITQKNLLFHEGPVVNKNYKVSDPDNGWQDIEWIPDHNFINADSYSGIIYLTDDKSIGTLPVSVSGLEKVIGNLIFKNYNGEQIFDVKFINTPIGDTSLVPLRVTYFYNKSNENGIPLPLRLDSITIDNDNFLIEWRGSQFNTKQPPVDIIASDSQILLRFAPYESGPQSAILKLHYEGGAFAYIRLQGNKKQIFAESNLKVLEPNGGEIFTPCQDTVIRWEGNVKDIHTKTEISYDNGNSWQRIDSVIADKSDWKLDGLKTSETAKVRVSQNFTKDAPHIFAVSSDTYSVAYNLDATKSVSFSANAEINEWDLVKLDNSKQQYNLQTRITSFTPISIEYLANDKFAVVYSVGNFDSLAVFQSGNSTPIHKERIFDFAPKNLYSIPEKNEFIIFPDMANFFKVYDSQTYQLKQDVIYEQPITDMGISQDSSIIAVAGFDSKVYILRKDDYKIQDTIGFDGTLIIDNLSMSANGRLIGINSLERANKGRTNSMIWDLESKNIITSLNISGSKGVEVGFSPSGNMAIFAYEFQNQINIFDLVVQSQSGIIEAFSGSLTDLDYSPQNNSFLLSSAGVGGIKFVQYRFSFPEKDESDETFRIVNPLIETTTFEFGDEYIFNDQEKTFNLEYCNVGSVPLFIENAKFKDQIHFTLKDFSLPDTLFPGECLTVTAVFNPKDTSIVSDSLIFSTCARNFPAYVQGNGLNRNIEFISDIIDLGEVCLQDTNQITTEIFRNADPVPLLFNRFEINNPVVYSIENYTRDTLLQSGEAIIATVKASPDALGEIISSYDVLHSNQAKYRASAQLRVIGIGTYVELSHSVLPFIPEQKIRYLSIKNTGENPVELTAANVNPLDDFKVNSIFPIFINPGETKEIEIEWITTTEDISANLEIEAVPCLTQRFVELVDYQASSALDIEDTKANPLDTTSISLSYSLEENAPYSGVREFQAVLTINPKIFIPEYAVSEYGEAKIENMGIENGKRLMKLIVNGDFPKTGTIAKIVGYPGLSEDTTALMNFDLEKSIFWGASTNSSTSTGVFTLLLNCNDQIIIHTDAQIQNISPNPATNNAIVEIDSKEESVYEIILSTNSGKVLRTEKINLMSGTNIINFDSSEFDSGNYIISLKKGGIVSSKNLIIVK